MKKLLGSMAVLLAVASASGCIVREREYVRRGGCPGGVFIQGHYGPRGGWRPGHWRCPGIIEVD